MCVNTHTFFVGRMAEKLAHNRSFLKEAEKVWPEFADL